jgi:large subunit ribosomal protein L11
MIKKIKALIKLDLLAGKATPAPPVGPVLGQHGINIIAFCKDYNAKTQDKIGLIIPIKLTIYDDKSYSFILKSSPTSFLLLNSLNIKKGSSEPKTKIIGTLTLQQITDIAKLKLDDLNTNSLDKAILIIKGTALNMGIKIDNI